MSDRFSIALRIGGQIQRGEDLNEFVDLIGEWQIEWGGACADGTDVHDAFMAGTTLQLVDDQAGYDQPDALTNWCQANRLTYLLNVDGKYEYTAEVTFWEPGMEKPSVHDATQDGEPVMTVAGLRSRLESGLTLADVIAELEPCEWREGKIPPLLLVGREEETCARRFRSAASAATCG